MITTVTLLSTALRDGTSACLYPFTSSHGVSTSLGDTCPETEHVRGGPSHTQLVKGRCISGWMPAPGDTLPLPAPPHGAASAQGTGVTVSEAACGSHGWLGLEMKTGHSHIGQTWGRGRLPSCPLTGTALTFFHLLGSTWTKGRTDRKQR